MPGLKIADTVAAAGVTAIGALTGGALQSRAAGKASEAQSRATSEALAFEREREAARQREHQQAQEAWRQQWDSWQANRAALAQRYGMTLPAAAPAAAPMAQPQGAPAQPLMPQQSRFAGRTGRTIGDMLGNSPSRLA